MQTGYDRSCSPGHGCVFRPSWSDVTTAAGGHNGCDTRNDVLAGQLQDVDKGTSRCVVQAGILDDSYSGARIEFRKAKADEVQIDHVVPLAYAWDMGAEQRLVPLPVRHPLGQRRVVVRTGCDRR